VILSFCTGLSYWLSVNEAVLMSCACRCRRLSVNFEGVDAGAAGGHRLGLTLVYIETCCRLSVNTADWMPGKWTGQLVDIVWDEDGEMVRLPPRPAAWAPPPHRSNHECASLLTLTYRAGLPAG